MTIDLALSDEQEQLVAAFGGLFAKESPPERVRAAEPMGHDPGLWTSLIDLGVTAMAVPEHRGGWGASMLDLALIAELAGQSVAPAPIIETQVAARLLAASDSRGAAPVLASCLEGSTMATIALRPGVDGRMALVPAGAIADMVVVLDADRLLLVPTEPQHRRQVANLGSLPLADLEVNDGAVEIASGATAVTLHAAAVDEWLTLTAAALVGIGATAQQLAVDYASDRHAWGVPIGTFQAVAHPLADSVTSLDGARLLSRKAAWSQASQPDRSSELAAMAFAFASETSRDVTRRSLRIHGGYGFTLEHDIQLYYRRARAWARVWGEPRLAYRRAGQHRYQEA